MERASDEHVGPASRATATNRIADVVSDEPDTGSEYEVREGRRSFTERRERYA